MMLSKLLRAYGVAKAALVDAQSLDGIFCRQEISRGTKASSATEE
jgi:hypothetical protein